MTFALALALLARQTPLAQTTAPTPAPSLPLGTSVEFARAAMAVESKLVEGDVPGAREAAKALPLRRPRIRWDLSLLPYGLKADQATRLTGILARWNALGAKFEPQPTEGEADLEIGLAKLLPLGPDKMPLATQESFGSPFRATLGLTLGDPAEPIRPQDLEKAEYFVLGRYLGVPESPFPSTAMHPNPRTDVLTFMPHMTEVKLAAENLDLADRLRAAVQAGKPLGLSAPSLRLATPTLDLGDVDQGKPLPAVIKMENLGAGPLNYILTPDCSCFNDYEANGEVPSQGRKETRLRIDTSQYAGPVRRMVLIQTNDPEHPRVEVPVTFRSRPAYRFFRPGGDKVVVPKTGGGYDFFLFMPKGSPIHMVRARWNGMPAKVTWVPWSGNLADPDMGEGALPRTGWRFHVQVPPNLPPGRTFGGIEVDTDSREFPRLSAQLNVQTGIVADDVNMGDLTPGAQASLIVDRPNAPFRILGIDAGPLFKTRVINRRGGWEHRIDLTYVGGAQKGDFWQTLRIRTDDPKQKVVETSVRGYVR